MLLSKLFGTKSEREIKKLIPIVAEINQVFDSLKTKNDDELKNRTNHNISIKFFIFVPFLLLHVYYNLLEQKCQVFYKVFLQFSTIKDMSIYRSHYFFRFTPSWICLHPICMIVRCTICYVN